jgi:aldose sugar dehydrogenase
MYPFVRFGLVAGVLLTAGLVLLQPTVRSQGTAQQQPGGSGQATPTQPPAPSGQGPGRAGGPGGQQGRGGGRGNPGAMLYTERCAGCHGVDITGGRAPSLFDDVWTRVKTDDDMARIIAEGVPQTEMFPLKDTLTEQQIWQIVTYIRMAAGTMKPRPEFVASPDGIVIASEKHRFRMEVVAADLETPWGLAFLPDGRMLVTERPGRLRLVENGRLLPPIAGTPKVWERQDAGMFDVAVHPQYEKTGWIYLSYAEPLPNYTPPPPPPEGAAPAPGRGGRGPQPPGIPSMTVVVRGKINAKNEWVDQEFLYRPDSPELYTTNNTHFGSRFIFDPEGHLFYSIGERGVIMHAQDLSRPTGKIHRVHDDGRVPKDNPFVNHPGALPTIWSYGHRNPQGLAWDPVSGTLWSSEHGPQGGDEINIIEPGKNYGWGVITSGIQAGIDKRAAEGMEQPVVYFTPTLAPSGIAFYTGPHFPRWTNNLLVTGLAGQQLRRLEIAGDTVAHQEVLFNQFGRVRDVAVGPDGHLYVLLQAPGPQLSASTPGILARLVPVQ